MDEIKTVPLREQLQHDGLVAHGDIGQDKGPERHAIRWRIRTLAEPHQHFRGTATMVIDARPVSMQVYPSAHELRLLAQACQEAADALDPPQQAASAEAPIPIPEAQDSDFGAFEQATTGASGSPA